MSDSSLLVFIFHIYIYNILFPYVQVGSWAIQQYLVGKIQSIGFGKNGYWIGANDRNSEGAWRWDSGKVVM